MGKLPDMRYGADYRQIRQAQFGGLKHCRSCGDGEIYDMENVSFEEYPLLQSRHERTKLYRWENLRGVSAFYIDNGKALCVSGNELTVRTRNAVLKLISDLSAGAKHQFVRFGDRVVLLPEMRLLNLIYEIAGIKESASELPESAATESAYAVRNTSTLSNYYDIYVYDGTNWINNGRFDQPMAADTGVLPSALFTENSVTLSVPLDYITKSFGFKTGDAVTISGCETKPGNNKTAIIREITGDSTECCLRFSDHCFALPEGETEHTENNVRIRRMIPDMDFMFECNNRMWGAKGKRIYASKLGDPTNWYYFDGLSTDSWSIDTQTKGKVLDGWGDYYPYFLREDGMTVVYGTVPSGYQVYDKRGVPGLATGEQRSIAHAGGLTLWLSREGVVVYGSDDWRIEKDTFLNWDVSDMIGVSAGSKAYFLCELDGRKAILCFDSTTGQWEKQNGAFISEMCYDGGVVYGLEPTEERTDIVIIDVAGSNLMFGEPYETEVVSFVQFGDIYLNTENRKATDQLLLRAELEKGARLLVQIMYDSSGKYETLKTITAEDAKLTKKQIMIPIQPRRCDHYHIRLEGVGGWTLYSMTENVRVGSEK